MSNQRVSRNINAMESTYKENLSLPVAMGGGWHWGAPEQTGGRHHNSPFG